MKCKLALGLDDKKNSRDFIVRGISLAETAIVLGVIGAMIGAIWIFTNSARERIKQEELAREIVSIVGNIRSYYRGQGAMPLDVSGSYDNFTHYLASRNIIPIDMIRDRSAAILRADHPWGRKAANGVFLTYGGVAVCSNINSTFCPGSTQAFTTDGSAFRIQIRGLSLESCINVTMKLGQETSYLPGLINVLVNDQNLSIPVRLVNARTACNSSPISPYTYSIIDLVYKIRQ